MIEVMRLKSRTTGLVLYVPFYRALETVTVRSVIDFDPEELRRSTMLEF